MRQKKFVLFSFVPGELTEVRTVRALTQRLASFYSKCITVNIGTVQKCKIRVMDLCTHSKSH